MVSSLEKRYIKTVCLPFGDRPPYLVERLKLVQLPCYGGKGFIFPFVRQTYQPKKLYSGSNVGVLCPLLETGLGPPTIRLHIPSCIDISTVLFLLCTTPTSTRGRRVSVLLHSPDGFLCRPSRFPREFLHVTPSTLSTSPAVLPAGQNLLVLRTYIIALQVD